MRNIKFRNQSFSVSPTPRYDGFWSKYESGLWEAETFHVMDRFLKSGSKYIDVGAWVGPTVLYAASLGADVTTFEPDQFALDEIKKNLGLNPEMSVKIVEAALSASSGSAVLRSAQFGNSESTIATDRVRKKSGLVTLENEQACQTISVDDAFNKFDMKAAALVKIDIEGGEYPLIDSISRLFVGTAVPLYISFHPHSITDEDESIAQKMRISESLNVAKKFENYKVYRPHANRFEEVNLIDLITSQNKPLWDGYVFISE